jgi:adenylate kinase family enzyme
VALAKNMRIKNDHPQSERSFHVPSDGFFVDRGKECERLREAVLSRRSLMIMGPEGIGKTTLALKVIAELPLPLQQRCLYVSAVNDLQDLLRKSIVTAFEAGDTGLRQEIRSAGVSRAAFPAWLRRQSSSRLRGMLYRTVGAAAYRIFLDHFPPLTPALARVVKELFWMRDTPVYLISSLQTESEIFKAGHFFYWGENDLLRLGPLPTSDARALLDRCIQRFGLAHLDLEGFGEEVLDLSRRVPGAIVDMCKLATNPRYQFDSRVKTKLLRIDYLMRGCARTLESTPTA